MSRKTALGGSLNFIGLADVFQILGGNGSTGVLVVRSQYAPNPGYIYFEKGNPINAASGSLKGINALYTLFGWLEGVFEFKEEEIHTNATIKQGRMEIVLDALRMLDDGEIKKVGPASLEDTTRGKGDPATDGKSGMPVIKGPFVDYSCVLKEEEYPDGKNIVEEGKHGKWMWVIFEGTVRVSRKTPEGSLPVSMLGKGSFIGTFDALLFGEYARNATVEAVGDVRLCLLDMERLFEEYSVLSPVFKKLLLHLNRRLKQTTDRVVDLNTKKVEIKDLIKDKEVILKKGSSDEYMFKVTEGEACVVGHTRKGALPILTLKEDDLFGYLPFIDMGHEPQSASVLATKDMKVEKLDTASLQKEYDGLSTTFRNMIFNLTTCISVTTRLAYRLYERD